ncbi:MAG: hybrid sensor histidine kinase/response regulator [Cyanobacteria bacterium P01_G01_bin.54]
MVLGEILVVDDVAENLEIVSQVLEDADYEVATVLSGEQALKLVQQHPPELILLDVMMPRIDGFETCRRLKANPATAGIPVIFMTALNDAASKVAGFELGAVDYITKPFQEQELLARVQNHLHLRRHSQTLEQNLAGHNEKSTTDSDSLKVAQLQPLPSEPMSTLNSLITVIAQEINHPTRFLTGNIQPAQDYIQDLFRLIDFYQQNSPPLEEVINSEPPAIDLEEIREHLPALLASIDLGIKRLYKLSQSLWTFSHQEHDIQSLYDLHQGIENILLILQHRLQGNQQQPSVKVLKKYGDIPPIQCFPGQINQVLMNVITNALDAFDELNQGKTTAEIMANSNSIMITTTTAAGKIEVQIQDNAGGMTVETQANLFEQGFTTKPIGKGTGLGLTIAQQIITENHQGTIDVYSELGQGSTFTIYLPLP